jgi:hypothetical protein
MLFKKNDSANFDSKSTKYWKYRPQKTKSRKKLYIYLTWKVRFLYYFLYNIAFVNSKRWLAKSLVDITQCQHGSVGKFLSLYFFVLYYKTNLKLFSVLIYSYINTRGNWESKTRNCLKTLRPSGVVFPHNFSFSQFPFVLI